MKMFSIITLWFVLTLPCLATADSHVLNQRTSRPATASTTSQAEIDSLRAQVRLLQDRQTEQYFSILEKTNQQLSLWFNPYGIIIASLAVLFALLAIVASVIIYRQGKEYKERLDAFVTSYQGVLDKLIKEWQDKRDEIENRIEGYQDELASATDEQKKTLEAEIAKLKAQKDSVSSDITSTVASIPASGGVLADLLGLPANKLHKCSQCDWGFMVTVPSQRIKGVTFYNATVKCPKCGNVDEIRY